MSKIMQNSDIIISESLIDSIIEIAENSRVFIIIDSSIKGILNNLSHKNILGIADYIGSDESKTFAVLEKLISDMINSNLNRSDLVIAIGGGACLDIAGFASHIYKRGVEWITIPSTLLAMVDAGIGGKTAINTEHGKNMVGAFHMPNKVILIFDLLNTLPKDLIYSGFGEMLKTSMIFSKGNDLDYKALLKCNISDINYLKPYIAKYTDYKLSIVLQDPYDQLNIRAVLNFGHTYAHAIEKALHGNLEHGIAVMYGIDFALYQSVKYCNFENTIYEEYSSWLKSQSFYSDLDIDSDTIANYMQKDKKRIDDNISMILLEDIGIPKIVDISVINIKSDIISYLEKGGKIG